MAFSSEDIPSLYPLELKSEFSGVYSFGLICDLGKGGESFKLAPLMETFFTFFCEWAHRDF